ncbi:hypothetical protein ACFC1I_17230 [Microbacterium sp. NPDC056044]|uniref:hypothetical protein n=1 Tax=Microbacterium sp. NPDC056044 TaxID=3345690 RepID=UPI0035E361AD
MTPAALVRRRNGDRRTTRTLLQISAFAATQVVIIIALAPFTPLIAAWFPPAYALVAGLQTLMIFAARRFTGQPWAGTLAAAITGVLVAPFTAIGWLMAVPLLAAAVLFDAVMAFSDRRGWGPRRSSLGAGLVVGPVLFLVSLPVMDVAKVGVWILAATLVARCVAFWAAAALSARIVTRLRAAGVRRSPRPQGP